MDIFAAGYNFLQTAPFFSKNLFNFVLVVAFFVWLLFFKLDVLGMLANKAQETIDTIKKSEDGKKQAEKHLKDTKKSLKNVDKDVEKIVEDAKVIAKTIKDKSKEKLNAELENLEKRATVLKEGYEQKAKNEVSKTIANAAVAVSKEYIVNSLDENTHKELIYNFINDLDNMRVE